MEAEDKKRMMLSGLQVIDLADEKADFCSKLLADFGARVIKIEKPGGDDSRHIGPFIGNTPHPEKSLSFFFNNTGKLGITLDIHHEEGRDIFRKLMPKTDIIVESFAPGCLEKIGLGFEALSSINPQIILASVTGFGQTGPKTHYKSNDLVAAADGGQMAVSGSPETPPLKAPASQPYFSASLFAAAGILLAVQKRRKTGKGEHVDISLQEAVASTLEHVFVRYFYDAVITKREGNRNRFNDFYILPCRDGFIHVTLFQQWDTLVEWMASEGMAEGLIDDKWKNPEYRDNHRDYIVDAITKWTRSHTKDEIIELGQLMRFPWAPVCSPKDVLKSPHLKARNFFKEIGHSETGATIKIPGMPYQFSPRFPVSDRPAPTTGQDNLEIFKKELNLSERKLKHLAAAGVI